MTNALVAPSKRVKQYPSKRYLRKIFAYDKTSGALLWLDKGKYHRAGDEAGTLNNGYKVVRIYTASYVAHRLIWIWNNGDIPPGAEIDHINGNRADNRLRNLRLVDRSLNARNSASVVRSKSGIRGVSPARSGRDRWVAVCSLKGKQIQIGTFDTPEEAANASFAYRQAHGFTLRHCAPRPVPSNTNIVTVNDCAQLLTKLSNTDPADHAGLNLLQDEARSLLSQITGEQA